MCPECITSVGLVTAGVSSAGGVGAFVVSTFRSKKSWWGRCSQTPEENVIEPETASFAEWVAAVLASSGEEQVSRGRIERSASRP